MQIKRTIREHLSIQSLAYISAGVFLTISHNLYEYLAIRYFGYILLSISFILLLSTILFELTNITWIGEGFRLLFRDITRKIALPIDKLFFGILPMLTIAALFFSIVNEIYYISKLKEQDQTIISTLEETNLEVVLIVVGFLLVLYITTQILPFFIRIWRIGILFIVSVVIFIILNNFNVPNVFIGLYLLLILLFPIIFSTRRNVRRRVWRDWNQAASRVFFLLGIVLFVAGIPVAFSKIFSLNDYWGVALCFICLSIAFGLRLHIWAENFSLAVRVIFKFGVLLFLAVILYIWAVAFNPEILWILVTWFICVVVSLSPECTYTPRITA
ncbi:MAG: hypothetical protein ACYDG5_06235 [Dehalococcoidales bacterium]